MKKIWNGFLVGILALFVVLESYVGSYNFIHTYKVSLPNASVYSKSSVLEVTKTFEEKESIEQLAVVEENSTSEESFENVYYSNENNNTSYEPVYQEEVVGNRIRIGNVLDKPLMTDTTGDHFYLNHNIYGEYDGLGVPYTDFRTDFTTRKTIIYAHSSTMGNGPFQALQNYHNNKWFYDNNRYISIDYNGNHYTYEIFSVYVSLADNDHSEGLEYFYNMNYNDASWGERIEWYKNNSEYDTGVTVSSSDKILILQTCSMDPNYYERYYRYNLLIMGKLV